MSGQDDKGEPFVAGVYPMLQDETCFFLAVDFDKQGWGEDATAFLDTCRQMNVPATLERSRSGRGGHVWVFFDEAIPAALARGLGSHVLTETMERRPDIGLDSYDRFFPNQDTLPQGGFGNLIALPLQKHPREHGHSAFVDHHFVAHPDQWAWLSAIRRISRAQIDEIVRGAERRGRVVGVRLPLMTEEDTEPWTVAPSRLHSAADGTPRRGCWMWRSSRASSARASPASPKRAREAFRTRRRVDDRVATYGHLIVDECHHLSAQSFEQVARRAKARFVLGLSATVARKDGHHPIIFMQCGPVRYHVSAKTQAAMRPFTHTVIVCPTAFRSCRMTESDKRIEFQALYKELGPCHSMTVP